MQQQMIDFPTLNWAELKARNESAIQTMRKGLERTGIVILTNHPIEVTVKNKATFGGHYSKVFNSDFDTFLNDLMSVIATSMEIIESEFFKGTVREQLEYPNSHSNPLNANVIASIVLKSIADFKVWHKENWVSLPIMENTHPILVRCGTILEHLTGGIYVPGGIIDTETFKSSRSFYYRPDGDFKIEPLKNFPHDEVKYRFKTVNEYVANQHLET
jgi:isopenicillin N synthase-like dioxygenase